MDTSNPWMYPVQYVASRYCKFCNRQSWIISYMHAWNVHACISWISLLDMAKSLSDTTSLFVRPTRPINLVTSPTWKSRHRHPLFFDGTVRIYFFRTRAIFLSFSSTCFFAPVALSYYSFHSYLPIKLVRLTVVFSLQLCLLLSL